MADEMGIFRVDVDIEHPGRLGIRSRVAGAMVDTGSELSWFPASILEELGIARRTIREFRQASGTIVARWTGTAIVHAEGISAGDEVVFGEPGDLVLLGSRTLEGLNLVVDPVSKRLVDAGPAPAAVAA